MPKVDINKKYFDRKIKAGFKDNSGKDSFSNTAIMSRIKFNMSDEKLLNEASVFDNVCYDIIIR